MNREHPMRRSTRVDRQIPVLLTSLDPSQRVCEESQTVAVSAHGCGILLHERIRSGTRVVIDLLVEQRQTRGVVIDAIPTDNFGREWLIGIEFEQFGNFWGLPDAPSDWHTSERARPGTGS
jgi:hypothetical protein